MMNQQGFVFVFSIVVASWQQQQQQQHSSELYLWSECMESSGQCALEDTFLVRTLVVPAMLSMSPWLNYWPRPDMP